MFQEGQPTRKILKTTHLLLIFVYNTQSPLLRVSTRSHVPKGKKLKATFCLFIVYLT